MKINKSNITLFVFLVLAFGLLQAAYAADGWMQYGAIGAGWLCLFMFWSVQSRREQAAMFDKYMAAALILVPFLQFAMHAADGVWQRGLVAVFSLSAFLLLTIYGTRRKA